MKTATILYPTRRTYDATTATKNENDDDDQWEGQRWRQTTTTTTAPHRFIYLKPYNGLHNISINFLDPLWRLSQAIFFLLFLLGSIGLARERANDIQNVFAGILTCIPYAVCIKIGVRGFYITYLWKIFILCR